MNILHPDFSPRPESHSRRLSAAVVKRLQKVAPGASISRRDFGAAPLPHATPDYATALSTPATLAAPPKGALDLSETLIREVEAADVIVIGTPMNNFTVPSVFKAWIDHILRVGRTVKSTPAGKVGMLRDRPVFIGIASGGVGLHWAENPAIPSCAGHCISFARAGRSSNGASACGHRSGGHGSGPVSGS